ncbi:MAG: signal transduction histidine kinase [Marivirga sp.]|jgi:signal transduction histidine kinase
MNDKPTYQELVIQMTALKRQNDKLHSNFSIQRDDQKKRADELEIANITLLHQSGEKDKRAAELIIANIELEYQRKEKRKRAAELIIANIELEHQGLEKGKRAAELIIANTELKHQRIERNKRAEELQIANKELAYQSEEKKKRADELRTANIELEYQSDEKKKRADELRIANIELEYQTDEKKNRAAELITANIELAHQSEQKRKRAAELIIANIELIFQNGEKAKRAAELIISKIKFAQKTQENEKLAEELTIANLAVGLQLELIVAKQKAEDSEIHLRALNATKDKLFSIIAHDLRSPLGGIMCISQMMVDTDIEKEDCDSLKQIFKEIHTSSKRTYSLLENLLEWSRIQTGSIQFTPTKIDFHSLLSMAMEPSEIIASSKNINISVHSDKDYVVFADVNMISTLIRNLLSNAVKFTSSNGAIAISSIKHKNNNFLEVSIKDTGVGIPAHRINDLFRIERNRSTLGTENETGTGLGLILCKEFIEKHNGEIWVESELGTGSVFKFTIPLNVGK